MKTEIVDTKFIYKVYVVMHCWACEGGEVDRIYRREPAAKRRVKALNKQIKASIHMEWAELQEYHIR